MIDVCDRKACYNGAFYDSPRYRELCYDCMKELKSIGECNIDEFMSNNPVNLKWEQHLELLFEEIYSRSEYDE